jgi:DNA-binding transcriptional ArsR family regulator
MVKNTKKAQKKSKEIYQRNAEIFKLLANPIRLEILDILKSNETSLDELSEKIGIRKPNTSQHLAVLRYLKIVKVRKEGQKAFYSIADKRITEPSKILQKLWGKESF